VQRASRLLNLTNIFLRSMPTKLTNRELKIFDIIRTTEIPNVSKLECSHQINISV